MMFLTGQPDLKALINLKEFFIPINLMIPEDSSGFITNHLSMVFSAIIINSLNTKNKNNKKSKVGPFIPVLFFQPGLFLNFLP